MFKWFKKKKKKDESKSDQKITINNDDSEKKPKKKSTKDEGPAWASLLILVLTVLAGSFFWLYGMLANGGFVGVSFQDKTEEARDKDSMFRRGSGGTIRDDGVIIFEK